jgi:hydrogenase-4 component F
MGRIRGAAQAMPATGALLLVGTLAITGVPPFAIFLTEFGIVAAAFARGHVAAAVILISALAIVFAGAFGHAADMAWGRPRFRLVPVLLGHLGVVALVVPVVFAILFGVYVPPPVSQAVQQIVQIFQGGAS